MSQGYLFAKGDIYSIVQKQTDALKEAVQKIPSPTLLGASEQDLILSLVEEYRLNVPVLQEEDIHIADSGETKVDVSRDPMRMIMDRSRPFHVPGTRIVIAVPFTGDANFFYVRPQIYTLNPPQGEITKGEILLTYLQTQQDAAAIKREYQAAVASIGNYLKSLGESASQFNNQLEGLVTQQVSARKVRLLKDAGMVSALGLPMKKREGVTATYAVPVKRKVPRIEQLQVSEAFTPEPALNMQDYEEILGIMKQMVQVMELSPREFHSIGEEALRSHFLVQLNGAYAGQATGETFNFQGKTDILIRKDGMNVFIAECKFWHGEKAFLETLSQLLSYLSWRDTKAAVLVFNRNADFSAVLAKIKESVPQHPQYKRNLGAPGESTFRYVFAQPNDANREIIITVLAFDIPLTPADQKTIGAGQAFRPVPDSG
jgi:hypothetical protein